MGETSHWRELSRCMILRGLLREKNVDKNLSRLIYPPPPKKRRKTKKKTPKMIYNYTNHALFGAIGVVSALKKKGH